ncbi:tetratricopeptide repeat protein [Lysinibacillus sphaericus]|uniref:tetratricopeptide repeat protein n=1 Tax=Lysinibacillus sphaericus TaxID=1421 RepID=UPI001A9DDE19|nr:tetratricopeptide repeat protein [Lysinibacillus sphaericus]QTB25055.1 tetratricopeptide repeat protein [Lysinibacillus sphaericus]
MIEREDIEMNENYEGATFEVIEHYLQIGKYAQTIELIHEVIADHLENSRLWFILGYSYYLMGDYNRAELQLKEALHLGYSEEIIFYFLGFIYMKKERWKEAEEAFLEALRANPDDAENHAAYAVLMKKMGHRKKAKQLITKAREMAPENSFVLRNYFILEEINSPKKQRVLALEQYMNSSDSELSKLLHLGIHAAFHNKEKEAQEYFRQAFLLNPEDKELYELLEEFELSGHPLLIPNHLVEVVGGTAGIWLIGVVIYFSLIGLDFNTAAVLFIKCYIALALYTWISLPLVKGLKKLRGYKYG